MSKYVLFSIQMWVLTLFVNAGHSGSGVIRNHIDTLTLIQDMFSNQAQKYTSLFADTQGESDKSTGQQEAFKNSIWTNVNKYTKLFLGQTDGMKGKRYRKLGGEKPAEVTH